MFEDEDCFSRDHLRTYLLNPDRLVINAFTPDMNIMEIYPVYTYSLYVRIHLIIICSPVIEVFSLTYPVCIMITLKFKFVH